MLDTSARLLRLLSLFQACRYWSGAALSQRLEVTARTLRRDVDRLRSLGYPVQSATGAAGGYQLGAGATLPPLLLDDEEAVAVAVGLRTAASGTVAGIEEASVRTLAKLEQVLPSRLRRRVAALHSFILTLAVSGPTVDAETLAAIAAAIRKNSNSRITAATAPPPNAKSSRIAWSTPAAAGIWSPGTSTATTGAPFVSTALPPSSPPVRVSRRANLPTAVSRNTFRAVSATRPIRCRRPSFFTRPPRKSRNESHGPSACSNRSTRTPAVCAPAPSRWTCSACGSR